MLTADYLLPTKNRVNQYVKERFLFIQLFNYSIIQLFKIHNCFHSPFIIALAGFSFATRQF